MNSFFRCLGIIIMVFATSFIMGGCAKHPSTAGTGAHSSADPKKVIVAKVNSMDITLNSVQNMMARMSAASRQTSTSLPEPTFKKALDQAIVQELAIQEARKLDLHVPQQQIDSAITALVGHDQSDYEKLLDGQKMTDPEFRAAIERSFLLKLIFTQEVIEKVKISDDDARKEYESGKERYISAEKVAVVDAALTQKPEDPTAVKKAEEILARTNGDKGKNLRNVAESEAAFSVREVDLQKEKEPALYDAALKLKPGELSGVIKAGDGLHLIQLKTYTPAKQLSFDEVKAPLERKLKMEAQKRRLDEWEQELKKDAKIEIADGE